MPQSTWSTTFRTIVFSMLLGGVSGVLTAAWTGGSLADYAMSLAQISGPVRLAEERPRTLPTRYEDSVTLVREVAVPATVQIFLSFDAAAPVSAQVVHASGAVVTSDGWILTASSASDKELSRAQVLLGRRVYPVERVARDTTTPAVFLKIAVANLPVLAFGDPHALQAGDSAFVVAGRDAFAPTALAGIRWTASAPYAVETPARLLVLTEAFPSSQAGAAVTNGAGELIGTLIPAEAGAETDVVLPLSAVQGALRSLLREGAIARPVLGLSVSDLAWTVDVSGQASSFDRGALVQKVVPKGSADAAGLKPGDVIMEANGQILDRAYSLDVAVLAAQPDDVLSLTVDRDGTRHTFKTVLGPAVTESAP